MTTARVPLSALDLSPVTVEDSVGDALRNSMDLAEHLDELGYTRLWFAEHHGMPGIASASPALLAGQAAARTSRIRLGSGGVMLPNHAPLVVAEQFGTLDALYPGRIDLGIGRAPGTDQLTMHALRGDASPGAEEFPRELAQLRAFLDGGFPEDHPYSRIAATPGLGARPEIWLLGSSTYSARLAGLLGLPFCFARHFSPAQTVPAVNTYRESFRPGVLEEPHLMVCVTAVAADSVEEADFLLGPMKLAMARLRQGSPGRMPTPEIAAAELTDLDHRIMEPLADAWIRGAAADCAAGFDELLDMTSADEIMVSSPVVDPAARRRSHTVLAESRMP